MLSKEKKMLILRIFQKKIDFSKCLFKNSSEQVPTSCSHLLFPCKLSGKLVEHKGNIRAIKSITRAPERYPYLVSKCVKYEARSYILSDKITLSTFYS